MTILTKSHSILESLNAYTPPDLYERMVGKGLVKSAEEFDRLFTEFKRFAFIATITEQPVAMLSPEVDEVWHQFLLFTREYQRFCREVLGCFLHHAPETATNPVTSDSKRIFREVYQEWFGELPEVWGQSAECNRSCSRCDNSCSGCDNSCSSRCNNY